MFFVCFLLGLSWARISLSILARGIALLMLFACGVCVVDVYMFWIVVFFCVCVFVCLFCWLDEVCVCVCECDCVCLCGFASGLVVCAYLVFVHGNAWFCSC